ncbi:MAG TPA: hypothetical protein EYP23_04500 [Thermoplasmata archaeon]|nr:hypothetical protein [Thermoplasmata archaeon]
MTGREEDRKLIAEIPNDKVADFVFLHLRNLWAVDGLYFLGIEEKFGTEAATEIDRKVWEVMGKIEARRLKKFLGVDSGDIPTMMNALRHSGWVLDLEDKEVEVSEKKAVIRNINCRVQNTRMKKSLGVFPCKNVRWGFLKSFAKEFNPDIVVKCIVCPPDEHLENVWCEWEFTMGEKEG